ncbi:hypothetical protein GSS88_09230 [Corynebacterium sp. 3HC-13]|uniref:hypothetical protein n=1 Tax=Corynebacterium poyangense TaxID=2684405 RepID=UPI001CCA364C|nr:hypothetical protein [Corynebacterium poyangense]MBZ8177965.1 hypothetical protein [Corynebacterium poyangense]
MIKKKIGFAVVALVAILSIISILWLRGSKDQKIPNDGMKNSTYIGISTETIGPLTDSDRNNVFWSSKNGNGGTAFSLTPTYFPSIIRIGKSFAVPDENSIHLVDEKLNLHKTFPVTGLGIGTQSTSSVSDNRQSGAFLFNTGSTTSPHSVKVVSVNSNGIRSIDRKDHISSPTACDNGILKWIEFIPDDGDLNEDRGTASIVT